MDSSVKHVLWGKQTYQNETITNTVFKSRRKTTSVFSVYPKRETKTVKLKLAVFDFEIFSQFLPTVRTDGFENLTRMQSKNLLACSVLYHVTKDNVT